MHTFSPLLALFLALCLYSAYPAANNALFRLISQLYNAFLRLFTRKNGQVDEKYAIVLFVLLTEIAALLIGAIHPVVTALAMTPLFFGLAYVPASLITIRDLNAGAYADKISSYESLVTALCFSIPQTIASEVILPFLLCALCVPLSIPCLWGAVWFVLRALRSRMPLAVYRFLDFPEQVADKVMLALLLLFSCLMGKNPFHTSGQSSGERMLSILGIDIAQTHARAPVSGDIAQALLLCGLSVVTLALAVTLALLSLL